MLLVLWVCTRAFTGACIAQRDRRGRNVLDYAPESSDVRRLLQGRLDELEAVAAKRQEDLLASLLEEDGCGDGSKAAASNKVRCRRCNRNPAVHAHKRLLAGCRLAGIVERCCCVTTPPELCMRACVPQAAKKKAPKKAAKGVAKAKAASGRTDSEPASAAAKSAPPLADSCPAHALAGREISAGTAAAAAAPAAATAIAAPAAPASEPAPAAALNAGAGAPDEGASAWQTVCKPSAKRQHGDGEVPHVPSIAAAAMPPRPSRAVQAATPKAGPARASWASAAASPSAARMCSRTGSSSSLAALDAVRVTQSSTQSASSSHDSMPPASSPVAQSLLVAARSKAVKTHLAPQQPASGFKAAL